MGCFVCTTIVPLDLSQRLQCQDYESSLDHCRSAIDRLQSCASIAWMHDNAIHDLAGDVRSDSPSPVTDGLNWARINGLD